MGAVVPASSGGGVTDITFQEDATANTTLTTMAAAEDYYNGTTRYTTIVDLDRFTQSRLVIRRGAVTAAAGAVITVKGSSVNPDGGAFVPGNWTTINSLSIVTPSQILDSGWVDIPVGMRTASRIVGCTMQGGDGVQSPVITNIHWYLR